MRLPRTNDSAASAATVATPTAKYGETLELLALELVEVVEVGVVDEVVVITIVEDLVVGVDEVVVEVVDEVVVELVVVEEVVEVVDEVVVELVDEEVVVVVDEEVEFVLDEVELVVEVTFPTEYWNVVVPEITGPVAPQVALTRYWPATHWDVPPVTSMSLNAPVVTLTEALATMTRTELGLYTLMNTAVLFPGAGDTAPLITIGCVPE